MGEIKAPNQMSTEELLRYWEKILPDECKRRITRSFNKITYNYNDFKIIEVYRCMPLIGGEEKVPNWQVHCAKYSVVWKT